MDQLSSPLRGGSGKKLTTRLHHHLSGVGGRESEIAAAAMETGVTVPTSVSAPPLVDERYGFFWTAFEDLLTEVTPAGRIPWSSVDRWCRRNGGSVDVVKRIIWRLHADMREYASQ